MQDEKRFGPLWRKIAFGMGQKGEKCKEAVEIGMVGSLSGTRGGASRCGPGKVFRNFLAGLVLLLSFEVWMSFARYSWDASRRDPGKVCRNFLAGLVMFPGLEAWAFYGVLRGRRPGSKRCLARSDSRQPLPGLRRLACGDAGGTESVAGDGRESSDAWLGRTADSPCPDYAESLAAEREGLKVL